MQSADYRDGQNALTHYLNYYKSCEAPGYAVLVTGEWGTGKTYQVKAALEESERFYVSLYGLQSTEEIYASVFSAMFPARSLARRSGKKLKDIFVDIGFGPVSVGELASSVVNAIVREKVDTERVLIFDDLERCDLPISSTLGAINRYVEHHGCRVLVLAHDEKIADEQFNKVKEKIFGHTIKVVAEVDAAFDHFANFGNASNRAMLSH